MLKRLVVSSAVFVLCLAPVASRVSGDEQKPALPATPADENQESEERLNEQLEMERIQGKGCLYSLTTPIDPHSLKQPEEGMSDAPYSFIFGVKMVVAVTKLYCHSHHKN